MPYDWRAIDAIRCCYAIASRHAATLLIRCHAMPPCHAAFRYCCYCCAAAAIIYATLFSRRFYYACQMPPFTMPLRCLIFHCCRCRYAAATRRLCRHAFATLPLLRFEMSYELTNATSMSQHHHATPPPCCCRAAADAAIFRFSYALPAAADYLRYFRNKYYSTVHAAFAMPRHILLIRHYFAAVSDTFLFVFADSRHMPRLIWRH